MLKKYLVRKLTEKDVNLVLSLQQQHPTYYKYCPPEPSIEGVLQQMKALPPKKEIKDKYFIGFFEKDKLVAIMDMIVEYPNKETIFIGLFMVNKEYAGQGIGKEIIEYCVLKFKQKGFSFVRLGYMKNNLQSEAFWRKCQFENVGIETNNNQGTVVVLERKL